MGRTARSARYENRVTPARTSAPITISGTWCLTMSIGGSGGVFAPSLFMGALLGSVYGQAIHAVIPHASSSAGAYGLVGMGAVFAASARAPITAVLIIYELTGEYTIILPLMLAIVIATALPVIDNQYRLLGVITAANLQTALQDGQPTALTASNLAHAPPLIHPEDPLDTAIQALGHASHDGLPVLDPSDQTIVGWIAERDILALYRQRLTKPKPSIHADNLPRVTRVVAHRCE